MPCSYRPLCSAIGYTTMQVLNTIHTSSRGKEVYEITMPPVKGTECTHFNFLKEMAILFSLHLVNTIFALSKVVGQSGPFFCLRWFGPCRVLYRVQLTRPPLTELNQCAFTSDSYLFYSSPDIWNALFRTFVLRTKSRSTFIFVSVAVAGETFIITELNWIILDQNVVHNFAWP